MVIKPRHRYLRIRPRVRKPTILDAINDPLLFGPWFKNPATWTAWFVFLRALFALPMSAEDRVLFQKHTGRTTPPQEQAKEAWLVVGRRGGKSFVIALVAVFLSCFRDYKQFLAPGERGVVMTLAADRKQARIILRYVRALLNGVPMLSRLIVAERADAIELSNSIDIEIHTASFRSTRGYSVVAALLDEIAFWPSEDSANPDQEIVAALRPAMSTIPGAVMIGVSSPYARRGILWERYRDCYGHDGNVLVWQGTSRDMNPCLSPTIVDAAYADDPTAAAAEYGAQFRSDIAAFLPSEWIDGAITENLHERTPFSDLHYHAFADPSGGAVDA